MVETLQTNRTEAVHLLDQMVRQLPDGVYLRSLRQTGPKVTLVGYAQSNARVSTLMRNIETSPWLTQPELVEIKSVPNPAAAKGSTQDQRVNEFTLTFQLKREKPPTESPAGRRTSEAGQSMMTLDDLRRLRFRDVGNWPLAPKLAIFAVIVIVILIGGAFLDWKDQYDALESARQEEVKLREQYATKKAKAINFDLYVQQLQ